jgi:hypothetical protein
MSSLEWREHVVYYITSHHIPAIRSLPLDVARKRSAGTSHTDGGTCGDDFDVDLGVGKACPLVLKGFHDEQATLRQRLWLAFATPVFDCGSSSWVSRFRGCSAHPLSLRYIMLVAVTMHPRRWAGEMCAKTNSRCCGLNVVDSTSAADVTTSTLSDVSSKRSVDS